MKDEKDSDRLQTVIDAMSDNYEPRKPSPFEPEIFWAEPRIPTLKEYNQKMEFLLYLAENPNLLRRNI